MRWHIINQVWGGAFIRIFLEHSLPSLLAPGNLPALCRGRDVRYRLYTRPEDLPALESTDGLRRLREVLPVDLVWLPSLQEELALFGKVFPEGHKFAVMGAAHWHAIHAAWDHQAVLSFTSPDVVYSDGSFAHFGALADRGARSALLTGLHARLETLGPELARAFPADAAGASAIPARALVALALRHQHPVVAGLFYDPEGFDVASQTFWRTGAGQLIRAWHLQPAMIRPRRLPPMPFWSVDNDYTAMVLDGPDDLHVIDDSDDAFIAELMPDGMERQVMAGGRPFNPLAHALAIREMFLVEPHLGRGAHNRAILSRPIRIHAEDLGESFREAEQESDRVVADLLAWVDFLEARPTALHEMAAMARPVAGRDLADHLARNLRIELKSARERMALGRWQEAEAACARARILAPDRPDPLVHLARLHLALGRRAEAGRLLRQALEMAPGDAEALRFLPQAQDSQALGEG